jgi:NADH-quinone oxidoreductase subunit J
MQSVLFMDAVVQRLEFWAVVIPIVLGLVAVYVLLPSIQPRSRTLGWVAGGVALLLAGIWLVRDKVFDPQTILFYGFSGMGIVAGVLLVTQSNPVRAALSFALVILSTCGLFLLQAAPFLMAATTIVYAGAIIVTFAFVIMLARQSGYSDADHRSREPFMACLAGFVLLGALLFVLQATYNGHELSQPPGSTTTLPAENVAALGRMLFTDYLLAVEAGGTVLLVATIGAIAIAARHTEELR